MFLAEYVYIHSKEYVFFYLHYLFFETYHNNSQKLEKTNFVVVINWNFFPQFLSLYFFRFVYTHVIVKVSWSVWLAVSISSYLVTLSVQLNIAFPSFKIYNCFTIFWHSFLLCLANSIAPLLKSKPYLLRGRVVSALGVRLIMVKSWCEGVWVRFLHGSK